MYPGKSSSTYYAPGLGTYCVPSWLQFLTSRKHFHTSFSVSLFKKAFFPFKGSQVLLQSGGLGTIWVRTQCPTPSLKMISTLNDSSTGYFSTEMVSDICSGGRMEVVLPPQKVVTKTSHNRGEPASLPLSKAERPAVMKSRLPKPPSPGDIKAGKGGHLRGSVG